MRHLFIVVVLLQALWRLGLATPSTQAEGLRGSVVLLDRNNQPTVAITDGNRVRLKVAVDTKIVESSPIQFTLDDQPVATCTIQAGRDECSSEPFLSLGWHWDESGNAAPQRWLVAWRGDAELGKLQIQVRSRPVVMVHGFKSDWAAWSEYLGPEGFLAEVGISGFAVGDGQVEGQMNTGSLDDPTARTNTIHQNAMIIGQTIAQVKQATGAEMVDLLAHSMGGLISRYYIDSLMADRDVAQLIMLGSPMAGTGCAVLPVSLGLFLPASLEIRPSYVTDIFNRQITQRRGIAFHALAGNPILEAFKSPCTTVPSDLLVSQQSVGAIPLEFQTMPVLHTDLNTSAQVFSEFVQPLLTQGPSQYEDLADPPAPVASEPPIQFTRVFTGSLQPGQSQEIVIQIEEGVTVASFALYDTSRTLQVQVRGASGNIIELSAEKNGLVVLEDPAALFYLGYGFKDPRPGAWRVTLFAPAETPAEGAAYALSASMVGGVLLNASVAPLLPQVQEIVNLEAALTLNGEPLPIAFAQVSLRAPDGDSLVFDLDVQESQATLSWQPEMEGLYGIDLLVAGLLPDGTRIERSAFLSIQTQPTRVPTRITLWLAASVGVVILAMPVLGLLLVRRRRRR